MKDLDKLNPIVVFGYFIIASAICMFSSDIILVSVALLGAVFNFIFLSKKATFKSEIGFLFFFILMAIINPFFVRNGMTVLLVVNDKPITLEALVYGIFSSSMIIAVMYMLRLFSCLMTEDKLLYVFGSVFPKLSLILSGAIRYVSLLSERKKKIENAQKTMGNSKNDGVFGRIRGGIRTFSSLATWSLENSVITADSMSARGYGSGRRTFFSLFSFDRNDLLFALIALLCGAITVLGDLFGVIGVTYYPRIKMPGISLFSVAAYISYAILVIMPTLCKISEEIRWKYLRSKI